MSSFVSPMKYPHIARCCFGFYLMIATATCSRHDSEIVAQPRDDGLDEIFPANWRRIASAPDEMSIARALDELSVSASDTKVAYITPSKGHREQRPMDWCQTTVSWEDPSLVELIENHDGARSHQRVEVGETTRRRAIQLGIRLGINRPRWVKTRRTLSRALSR